MSALALLAARSGMPVTVKGNVGALADPLAAALYFVCSEALANVSKHARASRVAVEVAEEPAGVSLTVADDGIGGATLEGGSGLRGLADRVEALGGTFSVGSPPGAGTRVTARLPAGT
jgi:signal transduction histidine kinase